MAVCLGRKVQTRSDSNSGSIIYYVCPMSCDVVLKLLALSTCDTAAKSAISAQYQTKEETFATFWTT